jgi:hypothetical protein
VIPEPPEVDDWPPPLDALTPDDLLERAVELTLAYVRLPWGHTMQEGVRAVGLALAAWGAFWSCCPDPERGIPGAPEHRMAVAARTVLELDAHPLGAIASGRWPERFAEMCALRQAAREMAGL